jgi:hypothetical protein
LPNANRFGDLRRSTLSWCRRTRISASNANRDRNSPIKAHQINLQKSLIDRTINRFAILSQLFWVCGRDREFTAINFANPFPRQSPKAIVPPGYGSAWASSAISFLRRTLPNELKFSATITNAPGPPMTLLR